VRVPCYCDPAPPPWREECDLAPPRRGLFVWTFDGHTGERIAQFEKSMAKGSGVAPLLASLPTVDVANRLPRPTNGATCPAMSGASPLERMLRIGRHTGRTLKTRPAMSGAFLWLDGWTTRGGGDTLPVRHLSGSTCQHLSNWPRSGGAFSYDALASGEAC
jgi:hypothetical protein